MLIMESELEIPLGLAEMVPDRAGTSRLIILSESEFEYPLDLEGDLDCDRELELDLDLEVLEVLEALVSEPTGTSSEVDNSEAATEIALALDVPSIFIDAVDLRLGTSTGKIEYLNSFE
ncbi:hypothetical protein NHQ30_011259 [Ciborinia camelliae]|nr:hypothetical protein NHQ30_011259 [Ciborinia camelliae]